MTPVNYLSGAIDASGCFSSAWDLVTRRFWMYVGAGFLVMLFISCVPIVNFFLMGPVIGGFYLLVLRDMRGEPVDFGGMFKGFEKFVPLMVVGLIQSIPGIIFQILQWTFDIGRMIAERRGGGTNFYQSSGSQFGLAEGMAIIVIIVSIFVLLFSIVWGITFHLRSRSWLKMMSALVKLSSLARRQDGVILAA